MLATGGAVTAIYSVPLATVTGSGVSSMPDTLNANPAVQATDAQRPPRITTASGHLVLQPVNDVLRVPPIAANNQLVTWGYATWMALDNLTATKVLLRMCADATVASAAGDSLRIQLTATEQVQVIVNVDGTGANARRGTSPIDVLSGSYAFVTVECNLAEATDALKLTITIGAVVLSTTFSVSAGTAPNLPSALQGATTDLVLLALQSTAVNPFIGRVGPLIYFLGAKMAAATEGLLTPEARTALMNFEAPT